MSALFVGACLLLSVPATAALHPASAKRQKISTMRVTGGCIEYPDYSTSDVVLDEELEPTCRVKVTLNTKSPSRVVELQYYDEDEGTWVTEVKKRTSKGSATLSIQGRSCGDDGTEWCDGTYQYRVYIKALKSPKQPILRSRAFDVYFISLDGYDDSDLYE